MVTLDGNVLADLNREEACKAFIVMFGSLYIFDKSFAIGRNEKNKKVMAIRNFFEFLTYYIMDITPRTDDRAKRCCPEATKFKNEIDKDKKEA